MNKFCFGYLYSNTTKINAEVLNMVLENVMIKTYNTLPLFTVICHCVRIFSDVILNTDEESIVEIT